MGEVENKPKGCRWTDPARGGVPGLIVPGPDLDALPPPIGIGSDRGLSGPAADIAGDAALETFLSLCSSALASGSEVTAMQKRCFLSAFNPRQKT